MGNAPYQGSAPAPARSLSLTSGEIDQSNVGSAEMDNTHIIDPTTLTPGIDRFAPVVQTSDPPANPDAAARGIENEGRIGELVRAMGEQRAEYEQRMADMQFLFESQLAAAMSQFGGNSTPPLPPNLDPEQPVNVGQLATVLTNYRNQIKVDTIRSTVGLTPDEETAALTRFPHLQNLPEPQKSELLVKAVTRMRASAQTANGRTTPANGTTANPRTPPVQRTSTQRVVPHTEATGSVDVDDSAPQNPVAAIQTAYAQTAQIKDPKERMQARKRIMEQARAATGMTEEQFAKTGWSMR